MRTGFPATSPGRMSEPPVIEIHFGKFADKLFLSNFLCLSSYFRLRASEPRWLILLPSVVLSEEVAFIPGRPLRLLRDRISAQKHESAVFRRFVEKQPRLFHVVPRLVISFQFPFLEDRRRIDLRIDGLESRH